ncbi:PHP domain-containing protein [Rudaeicoccus suwonensis]|uniref:Putative hydrolase n=1 Tax=Rudaeicoccus suwonensis TaxID=657409 RepID=A0A561E8P7_9MICO|nr:PHP domain-containing protein [Rudaeicoccus suwonensis]TWE11977.1 putative hydrolase [Rudaeicoccus suwonensis]
MTGETVDRGSDLHTHSALTDGADTPEAMADAAIAAGLHTWGLSDHVRAESDWLIDYVLRVRGLRREGLIVKCGVEAKILDASGTLDLPADLPDLDYLLIADHQFPGVDGPVHPSTVAEWIARGVTSAETVVDTLVDALCRAIAGAPFRPIVAHPFSVLPKMGLSERHVSPDHVTALGSACLSSEAAVEINEKWRCPSASIVGPLESAGVLLTSGSDAHQVSDVGTRSYLDLLLSHHNSHG